MNELVQKLLALLGQTQPAPAPSPGSGDIDMARPWDSPVLRPPAAATPPTPPTTPLPTAPAQTPTMEEEALIQALRKKGINQQFAGATHNPIPG